MTHPSWTPAPPGAVLSRGFTGEVAGFTRVVVSDEVAVYRRGTPVPPVWVEGGATFRGHVVGSSWEVGPDLMRASRSAGFAESWAADARGSACCWVLGDGTVTALPDFFGGASLFHGRGAGSEFVSASLMELERWAQSAGRPLTKSTHFQSERILLGNGGLWPTSFDGVNRLEQFQHVVVTGAGIEHRPYALLRSLTGAARPVDDVLASIRQDVVANVTAIAASPAEHRIAHLTGGFDSRLVLGAILDGGLEDAFVFFTSGGIGTTDRTISDGLTGEFRLRRATGSGLSPAPPRDIRDRFLTPMRRAAGFMSGGPLGRERTRSIVSAGGGYGELLRSFFAGRMPGYHRGSSMHDVVTALWPAALASRLVSDEMAGQVVRRLGDRLRHLADVGLPEHFDLDFFYLNLRNRNHIGQNAFLWSEVGTRLDPLYSPHLLALGSALGRQERVSNIAGLDLMDSFHPALRHLPFDKNRYDAFASVHRPVRPREFGAARPIDWVDISDGTTKPGRPLVQTSAEDRARLVRQANRLRMNYWQLELLPSARQSLRRALLESSGRIDPAVLNVTYLEHLGNGILRTPKEMRDVYTALETVLWLGATEN